MTEKYVMFRVLYNPTTKEVYTNPEGDVYDFNSISELKTAIKDYPDIKNAMDNGYEVFAVVEYYTPILNSSFDDVFNKHYLVYGETFCYCDCCGKLFLQSDMSFTDDGAPLCSECYELHETLTTKHAVTEQICAMLSNNILNGYGNETFEGWCEDGAVFEGIYPNMSENFYKECEKLMREVAPMVDKLTYDFLADK